MKKEKNDVITFEKFINKLSTKNVDFKQKLTKQRTFLHKAALENDIGVLKSFLSLIYDQINALDEEEHTALFLSIRNENYLASKVLLHNGADPLIGGGLLGSCLNLASAKRQYYLVNDLLKYGADINSCDVDGNNSLHVLLCLFDSDITNSTKIGELLISYGCDPNAFNHQKWTPAHLAIKRGQMEAVKWILEYNEAKRNDLLEKTHDEKEIENEMKLNSFNLNLKGGEEKMTCLHLAAQQNNILLVEILIEKGNIDIFSQAKNEKLASNLAIQNLFLYKILKTYERNHIHKHILKPILKEKRLLAIGKNINFKSEAEISDDSSETRTFQKVNDLNEVTKDKRAFFKKENNILGENSFANINEQKNFCFNKFNNEKKRIYNKFRPLKQNTQDSLNETQLSDIDENKSEIDINYELEGQRGKNMRVFFGSPNNIRQIDALQKMNALIKKMKTPMKIFNYQSIVSKKITKNHLKNLKEALDETVENLKKAFNSLQIKIMDSKNCFSQRIRQLNMIMHYNFKLKNQIQDFHEERKIVEQFKQFVEGNPHLKLIKIGEKNFLKDFPEQSGIFFNQNHSTLAVRWLVYLFQNLPTNISTISPYENILLKSFIIRLFVNFHYENAISYLENVNKEEKDFLVLRYEAFHGFKFLNKANEDFDGKNKELSIVDTNFNFNLIKNNSSLKVGSMEISKEITKDKIKNFGSNYFSNQKQLVKNENLIIEENYGVKKHKLELFNQNMVTINSSDIEDEHDEGEPKTLLDELKDQKNGYERMLAEKYKGIYEEKYKFEGFYEKENRKLSDLL